MVIVNHYISDLCIGGQLFHLIWALLNFFFDFKKCGVKTNNVSELKFFFFLFSFMLENISIMKEKFPIGHPKEWGG